MTRFAKRILMAGLLFLPLTGIASAQGASSSCQDFQKLMIERKGLVEQLNAAAKKNKQLDPKIACTLFTKLSVQGDKVSKWLGANKDWCQVPDDFIEGFKKDHNHITGLRGQACKVASQVDAARKNAESNTPPAWGGGVNGQYQIPKGAL